MAAKRAWSTCIDSRNSAAAASDEMHACAPGALPPPAAADLARAFLSWLQEQPPFRGNEAPSHLMEQILYPHFVVLKTDQAALLENSRSAFCSPTRRSKATGGRPRRS